MNKKNKKLKQNQQLLTGTVLQDPPRSIKSMPGSSNQKKSVLLQVNEQLQQENVSHSALIVELQRSLHASKLQLNDFSEESAATVELLRLQLSQWQDHMDTTIHKYESDVQELILEKELLIQQNEQLQEQLEHYLLENKRAMGSIDSIASFVKHSPRLQLIQSANNADYR